MHIYKNTSIYICVGTYTHVGFGCICVVSSLFAGFASSALSLKVSVRLFLVAAQRPAVRGHPSWCFICYSMPSCMP